MNSNAGSCLITIGAFARLGGVSIKALRVYAQRGLLLPAYVSAESGYRLYSPTQLPRLHRILLLKSVGLPLVEIGRQLSQLDEATLSTIRNGLLSRLDDIQRQLAWVETEMRAAGNAWHKSTAPGVVIKRIPRVKVSSERHRIDSYDEADVMLRDLGERLPPAGRLVPGAIWHDCGQRTKVIDCEVFWVLRDPFRARASKELAAATMASVLHEGDESTIEATYDYARHWIADNRFMIIGPNRELYLGPAAGERAGALTEIQFPIERR